MKNWNNPTIVEVDIKDTAHNWTGIYRDGGYIGDGEISGHLSWSKPSNGGGSDPNPSPSPDPNLNPISDPIAIDDLVDGKS